MDDLDSCLTRIVLIVFLILVAIALFGAYSCKIMLDNGLNPFELAK